jgi:micrococcal nuclease
MFPDRYIMRTLFSVIAGVALGFATCYAMFAPPVAKKSLNLAIEDGGIYRVRSIVDGDTVVLENGLHLRYNGMNAPETMRWYKDPSPMSKEASAKNIELVENKRVRLKLATDPIDMHGRVVANVFLIPEDPKQPEIELREIMIKQGFAKVMDVGISKEEYAKLKGWQDEAKSAQLGIWGVQNVPKAPEEAKPFCASSTGKTYHKAECHIAKRIIAANRHEYTTAEDAEGVGLRPCSFCLGKK